MTSEKVLVRNAFARAAPRYDALAEFQRETGERLLAECGIDASPACILDAGCGTGHGLQLIAGRWPAAWTIALDFAASMLSQAPRILASTAVCGDIEKLPLAAGCVDLAWSSLAMQWCDAGRALQQFHRVLRAGGHLAVATLGPDTFAELRHAFAGVDEFRHTNDFIDEDTLRATLRDTGFKLISLRKETKQRHYPDLRSLLASVRELGASHVAAQNRRPGLMGKRAWQRFAENYEAMRVAEGLPLSYDTYFILASK